MEYIYDGSHLIENDIDEEQVFTYSNGMSLWIVFNNVENTHKCLIKDGDKVIAEYKRITEGEAFIKGLTMQASHKGEFLIRWDQKLLNGDKDEITQELIRLNHELVKERSEKEKAQKLASTLMKGILKDKNAHEEKMRSILEKHINEL
ncbi:hypothetical protein U8V72_14665 [Priestia filamentosa]|uniref:hypothetical protein n=1 Tax=Priestia filamentosa TaxID=1402861 RepID=UPI0039797411